MLQAAVSPKEQEALKMLWVPKDKWDAYLITHMHAIRAKFFPESKPKA